MKKRMLGAAIVSGVVLLATALGSMTTYAATGSFKDGPYAATTGDSGTCGPDWAIDLFNRNFTVTLPANPDGTYTVVEKFANGRFITLAGRSPGGCDPNGNYPNGTIKAGVSGSFSGTFTITVSNGTFNPNGACVLDAGPSPHAVQCNTDGWVAGFFGGGATYNVPIFSFTYKSANPSLTWTSWTNADTGNIGDISSN